MAYSPTTWRDGSTGVNATNMNKIESALSDQDTRIDAVEKLTNTTALYASDDMDDLVEAGQYYYASTGVPTNAPASGAYAIEVWNFNDRIVQLAFAYNSAGNFYFRTRHSNGTWYGWYKVTATAV